MESRKQVESRHYKTQGVPYSLSMENKNTTCYILSQKLFHLENYIFRFARGKDFW
jgi:hypothetical protein